MDRRGVALIARRCRASCFGRNLVDASRRPWMTACQATHSQPAALDAPMHLHGFEGVGRAGWVVAADLAVQRTDQRAIDAQEPDQHVLHRDTPLTCDDTFDSACDRAFDTPRSRSRSRVAEEAPAAAGNARTTSLAPAGSCATRGRNWCRRRRLTLVRTTALPTARLTTRPTSGSLPDPGSVSSRCTTTEREAARLPWRVTSRNTEASPRRFTAANTSGPLRTQGLLEVGAAQHRCPRLRRPGSCDPCGGDPTGSRGPRGCASGGGNRAPCDGDGCSAGRCACSRLELPSHTTGHNDDDVAAPGLFTPVECGAS